jgi:hypothetical protein
LLKKSNHVNIKAKQGVFMRHDDYYSGSTCFWMLMIAGLLGWVFGNADRTVEMKELRENKALRDEINELKAKQKYR